MDSLTTDPVAAVLKRLFQEAETADRPLMERYRNREVAQDELIKLLEAEAKAIDLVSKVCGQLPERLYRLWAIPLHVRPRP